MSDEVAKPKISRLRIAVARYHPEEKIIEIEPDLAEVHWAYAKLLARRYARERRTDFKEVEGKDLKSKRDGVVGQRMFQALLNEWRIPYIHDDPCFEFKEHRTFNDFMIYHFERGRPITLEIKTFNKYDRYFTVKRELWQYEKEMHGLPDYIIALHLKSENMAKVEGVALWL